MSSWSSRRKGQVQANIEHRALLHLLEGATPRSRGLDVIGRPDGEKLKQLLRQLPAEPNADGQITPVALHGAPGWLCVLRP
jgi:hypothetical protein